jgi:hypothetical protein
MSFELAFPFALRSQNDMMLLQTVVHQKLWPVRDFAHWDIRGKIEDIGLLFRFGPPTNLNVIAGNKHLPIDVLIADSLVRLRCVNFKVIARS